MFKFDLVSGALLQFTLVFIFLLYNVICAVITNRVMTYKGYEDSPGWTIAALFFGIFVLIGVAGLPLAKDAHLPSRSEEA